METQGAVSGTTVTEREIVLTRTFDAPRSLVFDAWTKPERVRQWWDPRRVPLAVCEIDLRPDGVFRFVHGAPEGERHPPFTGIYREVVPPERIVFTTHVGPVGETTGTILFAEHEGGTLLTVTIACRTAADRRILQELQVDVGTARTLDNLVAYVGTLA